MNMSLNEFYVYVFLDQRKPGNWYYRDLRFEYQPFYVGVGVKYRINAHFTPFNRKKKSIKNNVLKAIERDTGELPIHYRIYQNLTQESCFEIEKDFIKYFGRIKDKTGILSNLTEGGDGNLGLIHSEEYKNSLKKKLYQYDLEGNFLKEWGSLKNAWEHYKCKSSNIRQAIKNKGTSNGFQWRYNKEEKLNPLQPNTQIKRFTFVMIDKDTGGELGCKNEIDEFFKKKVSFGNISSCCSGKLKTYLGYKWMKEKYT